MSTYYRRDDWVTDAMGNAQSGASVYVCSQPATTGTIPPSPEVQLYADSAGVTPITQPVITDGYGHAAYYVAPGTYTVVYYSPQISEVVLPDQLIGTSGVSVPVAINQGGTGATTAPAALTNLGAAANGANVDINSLGAITGAITIAAGGSISINSGSTYIDDTIINANTNIQGLQIKAVGGLVADSLLAATAGGPVSLQATSGSPIEVLIGGQSGGYNLLGFGSAYSTQTTVGTAGSATALPSNPSGYLMISIAGTKYVLPFYKQS